MELMQEIPDGSIDMVLCDLPYGETQNPRDKPIPFARLWAQYKRIVKGNGAILLFGQGKFFVRVWHRWLERPGYRRPHARRKRNQSHIKR